MTKAMNQGTEIPPADIIIFGGMGDLSLRKILPGLYFRLQDGQLPATSRIFVLGRKEFAQGEFEMKIKQSTQGFVAKEYFNNEDYAKFEQCLHYVNLDASKKEDFLALNEKIQQNANETRVFYLATPASIFGDICRNLHEGGLITEHTRVVLEKPIGYDLETFRKINQQVMQYLTEKQIYRIDHYLGKETVQNLMVIRFANNLFERVWNGDNIDHVQITVAEDLGVGDRGGYYDTSGAMRDMVQNHLLQMLCLVAMEPPSVLDADSVRDEKLKVLRSLRPIEVGEVRNHTVRGQYRDGAIKGQPVKSYLDDLGANESNTETFVALKAYIDNWRWSNVPFYLRTGKRLVERFSEIVIQFKAVPHHIFPGQKDDPEVNKLIIRLQPDERIKLAMITKVPGPGGYRLKPVNLDLSLAEEFTQRSPDAYERLLMDVVRGNPTLFMRSDEVEAAWIWSEYILRGWQETGQKAKKYTAGSWGPEDAFALIAQDGRKWHEG